MAKPEVSEEALEEANSPDDEEEDDYGEKKQYVDGFLVDSGPNKHVSWGWWGGGVQVGRRVCGGERAMGMGREEER